MRQTGVAKTAVLRCQERFMQAGVDALLRDKTRPSRIPPLAPEVIERVVALPLTASHGESTHWTAAAMADQVGLSISSVQPVWRDHGLQRRRVGVSSAPLYSHWSGFETAYTAVYRPAAGQVDYLWPGNAWRHSSDQF
jgi:hypothetical protein